MHSLLPDEALHIEPQLVVSDQRQRLLEHLDEELFARGQQQVQDVQDVSCVRLIGHVVKRQLGPVELDVTRLEEQSLVVWRCVMRTRRLVVNSELPNNHCGPLPRRLHAFASIDSPILEVKTPLERA